MGHGSEKLGPFKTMKITGIEFGSSADNLAPLNDDRVHIYTLGYRTLTMVSNLDKERDQKPTLDVYEKSTD